MQPAPARKAAFAALLAVDRGAWSAEAIANKCHFLDARDAGLASDIVFGVLRRRGELDAIIRHFSSRPLDSLDPEVWIALEMALYQIRFLDRVPSHAIVNDAVELSRRAGKAFGSAFVNAVLRQSLREPFEVEDLSSTPAWLLERWTIAWGRPLALGIAAASLKIPERYIRVGASEPPEGATPTDVPGCYILPEGNPGQYRFQDISAQAVVPLLKLEAGQTFLDLCAAPGNKTEQALETPVKAIACDLHLSRAKLLRELNIPIVVCDAREPLPFRRRFDRILLDAPCSGTGTLARNPEIKWKLEPEDFRDLRQRQIAILRSALTQLTPGGRLVYSTCSLEPEENEQVVAAAAAEYKRVSVEDLLQDLPGLVPHGVNMVRDGALRTLPGTNPCDGFYAVVLERS